MKPVLTRTAHLLLLCVAAVAAEGAESSPRAIFPAERRAVEIAADFLERGPVAFHENLATSSPWSTLSQEEALREIEVRAGPARGAEWQLLTSVPSLAERTAIFAVAFPSGADDTVIVNLTREQEQWRVVDLEISAEAVPPLGAEPSMTAAESVDTSGQPGRPLVLFSGLLAFLAASAHGGRDREHLRPVARRVRPRLPRVGQLRDSRLHGSGADPLRLSGQRGNVDEPQVGREVAAMSAPLDVLILTAAALIWLLATAALWMRQDTPRRALAGVSTLLFSAAIVYASNVPAFFFSGAHAVEAVSAASVVPGSSAEPTMSCSEIRTGMKASQVTSSMGKPDRVVSAEDRRGLTAELWIWQEARCRVYVFEDLVDFVE